jgi:hypothetical protein
VISAVAILTPCPAKSMSNDTKKSLAIKTITGEQTISAIANDYQVSRKFVSNQKQKILTAVNEVFDENADDDEVLYQIPVTKNWLKQCVISFALDCRSSLRGIVKSMKNIFDFSYSLGSVFNIIQSVIPAAKERNENQDLSEIKLCAQDEMFQHNKPVLTGVDIPSLYCYLLSLNDQRDGDTWAIHLMDLQKRGFNPDRVFADDGSGLRAGHQYIFPNTPCDADHFHISKDLMDLRRYFRNRLKSSVSYRILMESKMDKLANTARAAKQKKKIEQAKKEETKFHYLSESIDILIGWIEHDVFNMAGYNPAVRRELFDFVVAEFRKLEKIHKHRIRAIRVKLKNQRDLLLSFADVLNDKFLHIAKQSSLSLETVWDMCALQRCKQSSDNYAIRSLPLQFQLAEKYDAVEDAVIAAMNTTEKTSSMVENLNSRIRPYFFLRKEIGNGYLQLLQFYLNHTPFMRSEDANRRNKTPTEILANKTHDHWLELLGFKRFKHAA